MKNVSPCALALFCILFTACSSTYKPCKLGGDTPWQGFTGIDKKQIGNTYCFQQKNKDGEFENQGRYQVFSVDGKVLLEGEFKEGQREGNWFEYDLQGKKVAERFFVHGVDRTPPAKPEVLNEIPSLSKVSDPRSFRMETNRASKRDQNSNVR